MQQKSSRNGGQQAINADTADVDAIDTEAVATWIADTVAEIDDATEAGDHTGTDDSGRQLLDAVGSSDRLVDVLAAHLSGADTDTDSQESETLTEARSPEADSLGEGDTPTHQSISSPTHPSTPSPTPSSGGDEALASTTQSDEATAGETIAGDIHRLAAELQELRTAIEDAAESHRPAGTEWVGSTDEIDGDQAASQSEFVWVDSATVDRTTDDSGALAITVQQADASASEEPTAEAIVERIDAIETRVADLESALDGVSLPDLDAAVEQQRADQATLETRLESELDSIEAVFERLLSRIDRLDSRLDGIDEARQRALEPLETRLDKQDALVSLIQEALRHGVTDATCHNCDQAVEIGLLETPHCPGCGRRFTRVTDGGWLPFSTATLRTAATGSVGPHPSSSGQSR